MLNRILFLCALLTILTTAQAATLLQLNPLNGAISGAPGELKGWGFSLSNDKNFLVVTSATFASPTNLGSFTDFISASNFFVVGPARNGSTVWAQSFDATTQTGIGSFAINADATPGSIAYGQIVLTYDLFSRSPLDVLFNPITDTLSNGNIVSANASVEALAPVPLPASVWLFSSALLGVFSIARRKQNT